MTFAGRSDQQFQKFFFRQFVEVLDISETITVFFQRADSFLKRFLIVFADGHDFAHCAHLSAQMILNALEFLKGPAGKLYDDVVAVRFVFIKSAVLSAGEIRQCKTGRQLCRDQGDGETSCLAGQCGGAGCTRVDFNNDDTVIYRVVRKLHIGTADDADVLYDLVSLLLQSCLNLFGDGEHRSGTEGVAGMYTHGIHVLNKANGDHVVVLVTDNFQFQLFPAENGLFYKDLTNERSLQSAGADRFQLVTVVDKTAAGTAHCIGRT